MAAKHRSGMVNPCRNASSLCWPIGSCVLGASTAWPPGWKIFTCQSLDDLQAEKKQVEKAVYLELRNLFSLQPDLVFYDITSTYFEGLARLSWADLDSAEMTSYGTVRS